MMNPNARLIGLALLSLASSAQAAPVANPVTVKWYIGLGNGSEASQQASTKAVVARFNSSHPGIKLVTEVVNYDVAKDQMATRIAAGNTPDIVGPIGVGGTSLFADQWLDLRPYIAKNKTDLSHVAPSIAAFYRTEDPGGVPYAVYPSFLFYNKAAFDDAGLPYPPQKYGQKYQGQAWDYAALRKLGMQLTVDSAGNDATQSGFKPGNTVQYGFLFQALELPQTMVNMFSAGALIQGKKAVLPAAWNDAVTWTANGLWKDHFIAPEPKITSDAFGKGVGFDSGKFALAHSYLWFTCCITPASKGGKVKAWDVAVMPSYKGKVTAPINIDTFRIMKKSAHPAEAYVVLDWLRQQKDLLRTYGAFPADERLQKEFVADLNKQFAPNKVNWQVALDSLKYPDAPNSEAPLPNVNKAWDLARAFRINLFSQPTFDVKAQSDKFVRELQGVFDEKK
jgi:multiple sugar transport system substrate-binding protein